ncbi:MAG TPA: hypothetical protein VEL07_10075 [Planctomycetota bacterium]|nr:hypothetical protein [Planctomycetota bacterium]
MRRAFTLFEIAISLAILALTAAAALGVFPAGLKAQQTARLRVLAAMKACEMAESFANTHNTNPAIDAEAFAPWDVPSSRCSMAPDIEQRLASHRFGIMPLPLAIARRLDADGDEIARVLDDGALLYYAQPMATSNLEEENLEALPAAEAQKLVFAVVGHAQANALGIFPWKSWPYHAPYPSPPMHGLLRDTFATTATTTFDLDGGANACWEEYSDPHIPELFAAYRAYAFATPPDAAGAERWLQAALWYCERMGLPRAFYEPAAPYATLDGFTTFAVEPAKQVQAMRFLAHAAIAMTRWKTLAELGGQPSSGGYAVPPGMFSVAPSPTLTLSHDRIGYYHASCLALAMRFAASFPYDWGAPRPLQRATMMDYPLIEWDMFAPPLTGSLFDAGGASVAAAQWRPIPAQPIANIGRAASFPDHPIAGIWGDPARFTLTASFAPAERCRQLVFWSADWQSYEDAETAPSAPLDASRYPIAAPAEWLDFRARMYEVEFRDEQLYSFRNPEKTMAFKADVAGLPTGAPVEHLMLLNKWWDVPQPDQGWEDAAEGQARRSTFIGRFGADRNFNKRLDRGPVPASARMRATSVARFTIYDPRLPLVLH